MRPTPPVVLVIAGSDSGGGAGIQADLATCAAYGVFPTTAVTAVTAQNTRGVDAVHPIPAAMVAAQIDAVLDDLEVVATKTGMLATAEIVALVAERAAVGLLPRLVVDPVMVSTTGARLLEVSAERAYQEALFPHARLITPNLREAAVLLGVPVEGVAAMGEAARELARSGAQAVLIKGGHLDAEEAVDVLWDGTRLHELAGPRVVTGNDHGTGCSLASAIAARLAQGDDLLAAIRSAKAYVRAGLVAAAGWRLGGGHGPIDHFATSSPTGGL